MLKTAPLVLIMILLTWGNLWGQNDASDLKVFGYFQNEFEFFSGGSGAAYREDRSSTSFLLQQLNLFLQRDISDSWRAFVNFELYSTYSSEQNWGAFSLQEAWIRYRYDNRFNLKLGLQTPIFNNLNTVKNRTPLLPYIVRPLVYETSFSEFINTGEYVPDLAFVQVYGFFPLNSVKLDYAVYTGNSGDISRDEFGRSATDTTADLMVGARLGVRVDTGLEGELKAGVSSTYEKTNFFAQYATLLEYPIDQLRDLSKIRLGGDLQYIRGPLRLQSEYILVLYDEGIEGLSTDREFYHLIGGWQFDDHWMAYLNVNATEEDLSFAENLGEPFLTTDFTIRVTMLGLNYSLNDRITFKSAYGYVNLRTDPYVDFAPTNDFYFVGLACSVIF